VKGICGSDDSSDESSHPMSTLGLLDFFGENVQLVFGATI
jgi:hypothetical protein